MRNELTRGCVVVMAGLCGCGPRREPPVPQAVEQVAASVVELRFAGGGCSATRVSGELLLSAAHCALGFDGRSTPSGFFLETAGRRIEVTVGEVGAFAPPQGKMRDWLVLVAVGLPPEVPIARLASPEQIERLDRLSASLADTSQRAFAISFPSRGFRVHPRPPLPDKGRFISPGAFKSPAAYRASAALTLQSGVVFDDLVGSGPPPPVPEGDDWDALGSQPVAEVYRKYEADQAQPFYHSADYSPGSSGGGVFLADGALAGLIPYGAGNSRKHGYPGFGQAFRIDVVCRDSRAMSELPGCVSLNDSSLASNR